MHLPVLITDLSLILVTAAIVSLLFKKLRQPVVLGYLLAGLLVGPNFNVFPSVSDPETVKAWGEFGVIVLLFNLGLEFSFKKLVNVGATAGITAFAGVTMTLLTGFSIGLLMNWNLINSLFLGGILSISSTTIIIRAFEEMNLKTTKFSQIVTGALIVEDLFAVLLMVVLSSVAVTQSFEGTEMLYSVLKLAFFIVLWFVSGIYFLPSALRSLRKALNDETLLVLSLALCFVMVYLASSVGFSSALGAFVMGSIMAETTKAERIEHMLLPIKNLFGAIFFVSVGMLIDVKMMVAYWPQILLASMVLIFFKPAFVTIGALISGQKLHTSIQSGMSMSQIGEFSFIIASLGLSLNVTDPKLYPIAVAVSVLTTFTTPYMMKSSEPVFRFFESRLPRKWIVMLDKYAIGARNAGSTGKFRQLIRSYASLVMVHSVVIISIILLSTKLILPMVSDNLSARIVLVVFTLALLSPFLWALAFRRSKRELYAEIWQNPSQRRPLILLMILRMILALLFMGFIFKTFFTSTVALIGIGVAMVVLIVMAPKVKRLYGKIEKRFMFNLNDRSSNGKVNEEEHALAPWDTHISRITLDPNSSFVGESLEEAGLREKFGVNVARIERGDNCINVPDKLVRLFPNDVLFVIGTDEQLRDLEDALSKGSMQDNIGKSEISLQNFKIMNGSGLIGKSIRESKLRILSKGLVVGIERNDVRIINPDSSERLQKDDTIWIVGDEQRVKVLSKQNKESL